MRLLSGAQPIEKFRAIIDAQVTAAKDKLAKGHVRSPTSFYTLTLAKARTS